MNDNKQHRQICTRCKMNLTLDKFKKKRDDTYQKRCFECNSKGNNWAKTKKCEHNRIKYTCIYCSSVSICEHNRIKYTCIDCGGSQICEHKRQRAQCKECKGSQVCEHNRLKSVCKECGGSQICEHNREKKDCKICRPASHLRGVISTRISHALKYNKELSSNEYLGCDIKTLMTHIEEQFKDEMTWDNYGEWHIDHIIPICYDNPTLEEQINRLHYSNLQPLWKTDNLKKGNRYVG